MMKTLLIALSVPAVILAGLLARPGSQAEEPASASTAQRNSGAGEGLEARYARTSLRRATLQLEQALEENRRMPGLYSDPLIERLRQNVQVAEQQLEHALRPEKVDRHEVHVRSAEAALRMAESELRHAEELRRRLPRSYTDNDLERFRLSVEIARLRLERARDPETFASPQAHLQWQVEDLRQELLDLRLRLEELSRRG